MVARSWVAAGAVGNLAALLVALSTVDANKWVTLAKQAKNLAAATPDWASDLQKRPNQYERGRALRQHQKRLSPAETQQLIDGYRSGATTYELAQEFGIRRDTVARHLKRAGVTMRRSAPTRQHIDEMVRLYESGLSLAKVCRAVGFSNKTVLTYLKTKGVEIRTAH